MDSIPALIAQVDKNRLGRHLFHLSSDPPAQSAHLSSSILRTRMEDSVCS
jgi:hypothetical protein